MTLTKEQIEQRFMRVPAAGLALGLTSDAVYRLCQRALLVSLHDGSHWLVDRKSVERYKTSRDAQASTAGTAA